MSTLGKNGGRTCHANNDDTWNRNANAARITRICNDNGIRDAKSKSNARSAFICSSSAVNNVRPTSSTCQANTSTSRSTDIDRMRRGSFNSSGIMSSLQQTETPASPHTRITFGATKSFIKYHALINGLNASTALVHASRRNVNVNALDDDVASLDATNDASTNSTASRFNPLNRSQSANNSVRSTSATLANASYANAAIYVSIGHGVNASRLVNDESCGSIRLQSF